MTAIAVRRLARFELLRELGRGAQASVWLAHDPRLDREVALKLLDPAADPQGVGPWLDEARAVSRLAHPNVVPLFEADVFDGQPCLVFEFVNGPTLAQLRRTRPAWPAREAVTLMLGVLDALAAAHAQGIVHRDLKPSNILVGDDGRPRVMDFGIAARVGTGDAGRAVGTAGYLSPEAARGDAPDPAMDVFGAGVVLAELLSGAALLQESDAMRALQRVQREDLQLPAGVAVDDALRGIVQRALAREPARRYDTAAAMHAALAAWLQPEDAGPVDAGPQHGTLDFLLRRMRHKTDFPALSDSVARIQRVATSDSESVGSLSSEILKDVALTNKLLRMVNTVHFGQGAGGGVGTVSRAVALIGFAGVRNLALSVLLLEHMGDKDHAAQLKDEFVRALMAGTLAGELALQASDAEDVFLASMFQNLGRLLTEYYFPEEALQIRLLLPPAGATGEEREAAARQVLGLGFEDLGLGIARAWGLPEGLQRAMRTPTGEAAGRPLAVGPERLRWLGRSANALTDALLCDAEPDPGTLTPPPVAATAELYAPVLGLAPREMTEAVHRARAGLDRLTQAMGLHLAPGAAARRLLVAPAADAPTLRAAPPGASAAAHARSVLGQGLDELVSDARRSPPTEVLRRVVGTMHRGLDFRRVLLCLRDPKGGVITGRFGVGAGADDACRAFRVPIGPAQTPAADLFTALCGRGADMLIADASAPNVAARLPAWYRAPVGAPTFLLLPLMLRGAPVGLIYADKAEAGSILLTERELSMLRALRDQALAAFERLPAG